MLQNKKEILERVLLLMKYDNKQTLSENAEKINIFEQPDYVPPKSNILNNPKASPKVSTMLPASDPKQWEAVNEGYEDNILSYACSLSRMTFTELVDIMIKMNSGGITPDLINYAVGNPTIASVILENEIYSRRETAKDNNDFNTIMIPLKTKILNPLSDVFRKGKFVNYSSQQMISFVRDTSNNIGSTPQSPQSTLIPTKIIPGRGMLSSPSTYAARSATLMCETGQIIPKMETPKPKPKNSVGMDFTNIPDRKTMWEKIDYYWKKKNPDLSNLPQIKDSRINGENKDKYLIPPVNSHRSLYYKNWEFPADMGMNIFNYAIAAGYNQKQSNQILEKFGTKNEKGEIKWKNVLTKQFQNEQQEKEYDESLKTNKGDILKNELVLKVFPNASKIYDEESDENCKKQYLRFFQGIVDGSIKNKKGQILGLPYKENGNLIVAKWNEPTPPCNDEWWDKNGWKLQLGVAMVLAITMPGYGWGITIELLADTALNIYSLKKAVESQDEDRIAFETLYVFLPIIMATPPVRQALSNLKYPPESVESLKRKLSNITPNLNSSQRKYILDNLTDIEKRILTTMSSDKQIAKFVENETTQYLDELLKASKKTAELPRWKKTAEFFINLSVYGGPLLGYATLVDEAAKKKIGRPLNKEERMFWNASSKILKDKYEKELADALAVASPEQFERLATVENSQIRKCAEEIDKEEQPPEETKKINNEWEEAIRKIWMELKPGQPFPEDAFEPIIDSSVTAPTTTESPNLKVKVDNDLPPIKPKVKNN